MSNYFNSSFGKIYYDFKGGNNKLIFWAPGFLGSMDGSKISKIAKWAEENNHSMLRFDYLGIFKSEIKDFEFDFDIWYKSTLELLAYIIKEKNIKEIVFCGSSMGGFMANLFALKFDITKALVLVNPAHDFVTQIWEKKLSKSQKNALKNDGYFIESTPDNEFEYKVTSNFFTSVKKYDLLGQRIKANYPIHILRGEFDDIVPKEHIDRIVKNIDANILRLDIIKGGDHMLNRQKDIDLIIKTISLYL